MKADPILPLPPVNSKMPGVTSSLLYNGSRFVGHQKSKGNQYDVEVILQVSDMKFLQVFKFVDNRHKVCRRYEFAKNSLQLLPC